MERQVTISRRFRGPPTSGNGGYVAGLLASALGASQCAVSLFKPPPLDRPLRIQLAGDEARLLDREELIGAATRAEVTIGVPAPPALVEARAAEARFAGLTDHIFPGCFVCGPERAPGDGLRIFPGEAGNQVASSWTPGADLADAAGMIRPEFLWAALDCPGYFATGGVAGLAVLGSMKARLHGPAASAQELIVTGWRIGSEGRKHRVGTALHDRDGKLLAAALATWITLRPG